MPQASCLCGAVRFELTEPFLGAGYCHCERCRRRSGVPFTLNALIAAEASTACARISGGVSCDEYTSSYPRARSEGSSSETSVASTLL